MADVALHAQDLGSGALQTVCVTGHEDHEGPQGQGQSLPASCTSSLLLVLQEFNFMRPDPAGWG